MTTRKKNPEDEEMVEVQSSEEESAREASTGGEGTSAGTKRKSTMEGSEAELEDGDRQLAKRKPMVRTQLLRQKAETRKKLEEMRAKKENEGQETVETVRGGVKAILNAINRESQGKISFTRADQAVVNKSLIELQDQMMGLIYRQLELERENWVSEKGNIELKKKYEGELERRKKQEEEVKQLRSEKGKGTGKVLRKSLRSEGE